MVEFNHNLKVVLFGTFSGLIFSYLLFEDAPHE